MRILFVAMQTSVHTARWIGQLHGQGWDLHLFPIDAVPAHPELGGVTVHGFGRQLRLNGVRSSRRHSFRGAGRIENFLGRIAPEKWSIAARLARTIEALQPDILHTLEMQRAGYLTVNALKLLRGRRPVWMYSCWGNDIYLFAHQPEHQARVREVLENCQYLVLDCERDVCLARRYGFNGEILGIIPVGGGFDISSMRRLRLPGRSSERRVIAVKGYESELFGGRASVAINALELCGQSLSGYEIVMYSGRPPVSTRLEEVARRLGIRFELMPQSSHEIIATLMGRARIALGISISDGTPNTMLEAMIMGSFPVQSDTVSTREWIRDGENGLLVPPEDAATIAKAVRRALSDDKLVDSAADINTRMTREKIDIALVQPHVIEMYNSVATRS